jgi:hypothetical protein
MITVYFDTNFYIDLGRADDLAAASVIAKLNELEVRVVVSPVLLSELFINDDYQAEDRRMVERLSGLLLEPLRTGGADFVVLLADEELRIKEAARWRERREEMTIASSLGAAARLGDGPSPDDLGAAYPTSAPVAAALAAQNWPAALREVRTFLEPVLAMLRIEWPEGYDNDPAGFSAALVAALRTVQGSAAVEAVHLEYSAQDSILKGDGRLNSVGLGRPDHAENMAGEVGDAAHMAIFLQHSDSIDFLQLDGRQGRRLDNDRKARHILHRRDLSARCFWAAGVAQAVAEVERLIAEQPSNRARY